MLSLFFIVTSVSAQNGNPNQNAQQPHGTQTQSYQGELHCDLNEKPEGVEPMASLLAYFAIYADGRIMATIQNEYAARISNGSARLGDLSEETYEDIKGSVPRMMVDCFLSWRAGNIVCPPRHGA
ncbi:hypothetical protein N9L33_06380 [Nitrospinae bacterium]|nr:hypothetical protein [Nitrospinota bacterium]